MLNFKSQISNFRFVIGTVAALSIFCSSLIAEDDWQRVTSPRVWEFPRDHGAHREFKTEWWYFTGNLADAQGRSFGYQLTIFRQGLQFTPEQKESRWAIRDFYFGHFAVSDLSTKKFHYLERVDRGALEQSGASEREMKTWLQEWKIETLDAKTERYRLTASEPEMAIDLMLEPAKPLVLQGHLGVSPKSNTPGNASHYYSYPRLKTTGTIRIDGKTYTVTGTSWFDHEFSTSALGEHQAGWDWFSIQLDNGCELMLYQMRNKDGTIDVASQGTWIARDGTKSELARADFQIVPLDSWKSPRSGATYPAHWRVTIPRLNLDLDVSAAIPDQELHLTDLSKISYWEGACRIQGTQAGKSVSGVGYTELTGYAAALGKY